MSNNRRLIERRRYHKVEKRENGAILEHEHDWTDPRGDYVSCRCGASCRQDADGRAHDIIEATTGKLGGFARSMYSSSGQS